MDWWQAVWQHCWESEQWERTAMAMGGGGVDRSEAVAEEEKVPSGRQHRIPG